MRPNNPPIRGENAQSSAGCFFQEENRSSPHRCAPARIHTRCYSLCPRPAGRRWSQRALIHNALCIHQAQSFCATAGSPPPTVPTHKRSLCLGSSLHPNHPCFRAFSLQAAGQVASQGAGIPCPTQPCLLGDLPDSATVLVWDQDGGGNPDPLLGDSIGLPD